MGSTYRISRVDQKASRNPEEPTLGDFRGSAKAITTPEAGGAGGEGRWRRKEERGGGGESGKRRERGRGMR